MPQGRNQSVRGDAPKIVAEATVVCHPLLCRRTIGYQLQVVRQEAPVEEPTRTVLLLQGRSWVPRADPSIGKQRVKKGCARGGCPARWCYDWWTKLPKLALGHSPSESLCDVKSGRAGNGAEKAARLIYFQSQWTVGGGYTIRK